MRRIVTILLSLAAATTLGAQAAPTAQPAPSGLPALARLVAAGKPAPAPAEWRALVGEYGADPDTLFVIERDGRLHAIERGTSFALTEIARDTFMLPPRSAHDGHWLVVERGAGGRVAAVRLAGTLMPRRALGPEDGSQFRITPLEPVAQLRAEALAATPPHETGQFRAPELVPVARYDSTIRLDVRYATTNNFMGAAFYSSPRAYAQRPAAEAIARASATLKSYGYGLLVHDAYRPWYVTKMFWDGTPPSQRIFVADPSQGSRHNRGAAIDLSMYERRTGKPVEMTGGYDEMTDRSFPQYPGGTSLQRWQRDLLRAAMEAEGFTVNESEWWHFDYKDWRQYPIGTNTFEEIERGLPSR